MAKVKKRLDVLLTERGLAPSRAKAQALIMAGEVLVNDQLADKAGTRFTEDVTITVKQQAPYVSRGGEKLAGALSDFGLSVTDRIAADVGASTGGFTDCLLQQGAARVYAIDVGYGQLAHKLRIDPRVIVMERTNARHLATLAESVDLVVIDASYISLKLLLPSVIRWLQAQADVIALINPQFEAGPDDVSKGGIVRDEAVHARVMRSILDFARETGFSVRGLTRSPIKGAKSGNTEFLVWLAWGQAAPEADTDTLIQQVLAEN